MEVNLKLKISILANHDFRFEHLPAVVWDFVITYKLAVLNFGHWKHEFPFQALWAYSVYMHALKSRFSSKLIRCSEPYLVLLHN